MRERRRKSADPDRAAAGDGGWYQSIPVTDNRPTCSRCGTRTTFLDNEHAECLRCKMARNREAREQEAVPFPEEGSSG